MMAAASFSELGHCFLVRLMCLDGRRALIESCSRQLLLLVASHHRPKERICNASRLTVGKYRLDVVSLRFVPVNDRLTPSPFVRRVLLHLEALSRQAWRAVT